MSTRMHVRIRTQYITKLKEDRLSSTKIKILCMEHSLTDYGEGSEHIYIKPKKKYLNHFNLPKLCT